LPLRSLQKPLQRRAQATLGCFSFASFDELPLLPPHATSDPQCHGHGRKQPASEPGRIELDLDLFESKRRDRVAMSCAGTIEDRGRTRDEPPADFGLVQIGADHKERKNGPIMGVLRDAGLAAIDDPSDRGSAEASQHQIPSRLAAV
jgi:hypothetical protein